MRAAETKRSPCSGWAQTRGQLMRMCVCVCESVCVCVKGGVCQPVVPASVFNDLIRAKDSNLRYFNLLLTLTVSAHSLMDGWSLRCFRVQVSAGPSSCYIELFHWGQCIGFSLQPKGHLLLLNFCFMLYVHFNPPLSAFDTYCNIVSLGKLFQSVGHISLLMSLAHYMLGNLL